MPRVIAAIENKWACIVSSFMYNLSIPIDCWFEINLPYSATEPRCSGSDYQATIPREIGEHMS